MTDSKPLPLATSGTFTLVLLLFAAMFIGLFLTQTISAVAAPGSREFLLTSATFQNLLAFALPTLLIAYFSSSRPLQSLGMTKGSSPLSFVAMIAIFALALPGMNQLIYWNEHISLPESMKTVEDSFREMEEIARNATYSLLETDTVGSLIVNILIMGCLTGLCEETFFRAGLQRILGRSMSVHGAVWVSALVFSVMHFQFFGFVPRLILGAFFGYLYAWSGSLWLNAAAHAVNNSIVIVTVWLQHRGVINGDSDMWGVTVTGFPWLAVISAVAAVAAIIWLHRKRVFGNG